MMFFFSTNRLAIFLACQLNANNPPPPDEHLHHKTNFFIHGRFLPRHTMRLYLDRNLARFDAYAISKGFKLTHYVNGLSDDVFDRIKDWQNVVLRCLQDGDDNLAKKARAMLEEVHLGTENEWDGYHCFIGIRNSHAVVYFIPIESRETPYNTSCWYKYSASFEVDALRIHLAFSEEDSNRYAIYINKLTRLFEDIPLFLCCNVLTSFKALQVLAYTTALQIGNYRELESDCLEFSKAVAMTALRHFATEREFSKAIVNLHVKNALNVDGLTITNFKSEALSRRHTAPRHSALASILLSNQPLIQMLLISLAVITFYHFFIR